MKFELIHHFDAEIDAFVKTVYFDDNLNQRLLKMKNISAREVKSIEDKGDTAERVVFIEAAAAIPKEARAIVGEKLGWNEHSRLDKRTRTVSFEIKPLIKVPLDCHGRYEMVPEADGRVRRVITGEVNVKVPLIGKTIEKFIVKALTESFEEEEVLVKEYLRETAGK